MANCRFCLYALFSAAVAVQQPGMADESPAQNTVIVNSPDDRLSTVPTKWWTITHQSLQDVVNTISKQNARIVDISVERVSPAYVFTATYVENIGPYYKLWAWYVGIDAAGLASAISTNSGRVIALKAVDAGGGQIRFVAVMIVNSGKDSKGWWYYTDVTPDQITSALSANQARLVQITSYVAGGKTHYAVVMNSLAASDPASWWYSGLPSDQIAAMVSANNARLIDLDYSANGSYSAIMVDCSAGCPAWSWYTGQTQDQMQSLAAQNSGRIIDSSTYPGCDGQCYSFIVADNSLPPLDGSNAVTSRVGALLRAGGIDGVQGLYLKQVGGPVLANLEESFVYEPASSIKVLAHLYAMTQVQNGTATLADPVARYANGPVSCPDPVQPGGTETLSAALKEMMWNSDNARTREVTDTFGNSNINPFALSIGMQNTQINHIIGCGGPVPDQMTLADGAALYEGVAAGALLTPPNQATFYSMMAGKAQFQTQGYDFTHLWDTDIPAMIAQAAPRATAAQRRDYLNQMNLAYKAGGYVICGDSCSHVAEYYSISGWAQIPFCNGGSPAAQDYVFGIFLHGPTDSAWSADKTTVALQNFLSAKGELLREPIVAGLTSCGLAQ